MESTQNKKTEEDLVCGYLNGELTNEETRELIEWINLDKSNKKLFDEFCELWITTKATSNNPGFNAQEGFWKFRQRIKESNQQVKTGSKNGFLMTAVRYAAIFLIAFAAGGLLFYQFGQKNSMIPVQGKSELVVPLGSRASFTLADGTVVTLNAGSTLRTDTRYGIRDRIVELEGEGYFKVAEDKVNPFIVKTSYLTVTAMGTEFNVKAYSVDKTIETTLVNGSVKIEPVSEKGKGDITILQPNQKLTFYKEEPGVEANQAMPSGNSGSEFKPAKVQGTAAAIKLVKEDVNVEPVVSWKENRWIFENQSLSQIAVDLERRFDVNIKFKSDRLKSYRFTGTILAEPIEQVLEVLSITSPISFNINGREVILSDNKDFIEVNKELYTQPK